MILGKCSLKDHQDKVLDLVCTSKKCAKQGLVCSYCLVKEHAEHAKQCVPLKDIMVALNSVTNRQKQDQIDRVCAEIKDKHLTVRALFKKCIQDLKQQLESIEKKIEASLDALRAQADVFVGNSLQESLAAINSASVTPERLNQELKTLLPMVEVNTTTGEIDALTPKYRETQAKQILKQADVLVRETEFWISKSLQDLAQAQEAITHSTSKHTQFQLGENRFGLVIDGWNLNPGAIDAISFRQRLDTDLWLSGIGVYEVTQWAQANNVTLTVSVYRGQNADEGEASQALLARQECALDISTQFDNQHVYSIKLARAVKLESKEIYTVTLQTSAPCGTYYGVNGVRATRELEFMDSRFKDAAKSNSTSVRSGLFPVFEFEK